MVYFLSIAILTSLAPFEELQTLIIYTIVTTVHMVIGVDLHYNSFKIMQHRYLELKL